nr:PQ-loop repeat-containing protein 3 isoform X1 [Zonotrichia albicollis]
MAGTASHHPCSRMLFMVINSFQEQRSEPGAERFSARSPRESEVGRPQPAVPGSLRCSAPRAGGDRGAAPRAGAAGAPPGLALPSRVPGSAGPGALREGSAGATVPPHPARRSPDPRPGPPQRDGAGAAGPGALDNLGRVCRDQAAAAGGGAEGRLGVGTQREQPAPGAGRPPCVSEVPHLLWLPPGDVPGVSCRHCTRCHSPWLYYAFQWKSETSLFLCTRILGGLVYDNTAEVDNRPGHESVHTRQCSQ